MHRTSDVPANQQVAHVQPRGIEEDAQGLPTRLVEDQVHLVLLVVESRRGQAVLVGDAGKDVEGFVQPVDQLSADDVVALDHLGVAQSLLAQCRHVAAHVEHQVVQLLVGDVYRLDVSSGVAESRADDVQVTLLDGAEDDDGGVVVHGGAFRALGGWFSLACKALG